MSRCDVALVAEEGVPFIRRPSNWTTWWAMDGADDRASLQAMDAQAQLTEQLRAVHHGVVLPARNLQQCTVRCCLTGDGKVMAAANGGPGNSCWVCSIPRAAWSERLQPVMDLTMGLRYGAVLRDIPSHTLLVGWNTPFGWV